jgi:hypothetical protein
MFAGRHQQHAGRGTGPTPVTISAIAAACLSLVVSAEKFNRRKVFPAMAIGVQPDVCTACLVLQVGCVHGRGYPGLQLACVPLLCGA